MSILGNAGEAIRLAGTNLGAYLSNPKTAASLGKQVALQTAVGTALGQTVPRMMGQTPTESPMQTAKRVALHAGISAPIGGGLSAMGVPHVAAGPIGEAAGMLGAHLLSRSIDPETNDQPQVHGQDFNTLQHFHAAQEQQRYNNEINLALAKNYHNPTTTIVHKNPSAEFDTVQRMMNPTVRY
jgi:hypothetical protein